MNDTERQARDIFEAQGWKVLRAGWPDLLMVRCGEVQAVEVKSGNDRVKPHQKACHDVLNQSGIPVVVFNPTISKLKHKRLVRKDLTRRFILEYPQLVPLRQSDVRFMRGYLLKKRKNHSHAQRTRFSRLRRTILNFLLNT